MSLLTTEYNSNSGGNNSGDGDYEERDSLKMSNYAIVSFELSGDYNENSSQFGQSVYVDLDDVRVLHGLVYDRFYNDDDDTMKVFGFGEWFQTNEDGTLNEEVQEDLINKRISEKFGGDTYPYELDGFTTEDDDEEISLGDMTMNLSSSTKYQTILKVISEAGHDVIADKDSDDGWVDTNKLGIRDDLLGRRLILFFKINTFTPEGEDDTVSYTDAVVLNADTGAGITINNEDSSSSSSEDTTDDESASGSIGGDSGGDADDLPDGVPAAANEIIDFMARTDETDPANVEQFIEGEVDSSTEYDVEAVIEVIEDRM